MVKLEKTYSVERKGSGRADNIGKVFSDRVKTFKGLDLLPNEKIKKFILVASPIPSIWPGHRLVLAPGDSAHLVDSETFLPTPYTSGVGYEFRMIRVWGSADQPALVRTYLDEFPPGNPLFLASTFLNAGGVYIEQDIGMPTTAFIDPDFEDIHILDFIVFNAGVGDMRASTAVTALLVDNGSDPDFEHNTKNVRCPFCGKIKTVPISDTKITCDNGHDFIVEYHPWGGV